jgi:quercetin dioxygenase-like cupin family protein
LAPTTLVTAPYVTHFVKEVSLKFNQVIRRALSASAILAGIASVPLVLAQLAAPTESKGVSVKLVGAIPLAPEISGIDNRQLRMRVVTLAPGGVFAVHSHTDRPTVEYVLKGSATEFRGEASKGYVEGDSVLADKGTTHWWRNDGTEPTVFVAVDVFNPPK